MVRLMKKNFYRKAIGIVLSTLLLNACGFSIPFIDNSSDYKKGGVSARPLEVPPDLTSANSSDAYNISGSTSYSSYSEAQEGQEVGVAEVLSTPDGVRMEKAGGQRWLVVDAPAEKVWPVVREFWLDQGFAVRIEDAQTGVIETEWVRSDDIDVEEDTRGYGERFDKWMDKLSGLADRRKFRTRLERGEIKTTTEIYMTHRTVAGTPDDGKERIQTQLGEIDTGYRADKTDKTIKLDEYERDLDAELLRRLMVKLGVAEEKAKQIANSPVREKRAEVVKKSDHSVTLKLRDSYDRGWRRVGLALDRIGFVVEDKNRAEGVFYVRYADINIDDTPKKKKGLFETLAFWDDGEEEIENKSKSKEEGTIVDKLKFWKGKDEKADPSKKYRIKVSAIETGTRVNMVDSEGGTDAGATANRIISLLYDQLK